MCPQEGVLTASNDVWPLERPDGMPAIQSLEVMCGKDHMDVHLQFTQPFEGIVSSKGQYGDPRCVYVPPSTGKTYYTFRIAYARCGTKPDLNGQFYENTVVVQYDKDLLEVWDEAKRLRCEWYNDYEKTASKPPMVIADLDVIQLDFRGIVVDEVLKRFSLLFFNILKNLAFLEFTHKYQQRFSLLLKLLAILEFCTSFQTTPDFT